MNYTPHIASLAAGFLIPMSVVLVTGVREPWDHNSYFFVALPVMCVAAAAIAAKFRTRTWLWPILMGIGQVLAMLTDGGSWNLWPIAVAAMLVFTLPQFLTSLVAGFIARRVVRD